MTIYMDMDGCIARWSTEDTEEDTYRKGYFLHREPEPELIRLLNLLREENRDVRILSCAYSNAYAVPEKKAWLEKYGLSDIPAIFVPIGSRKKWECVEEKDKALLISDYSEELHECAAEGIRCVKYYNGINGTHRTWHGPSISLGQTAEEMLDTLVRLAG